MKFVAGLVLILLLVACHRKERGDGSLRPESAIELFNGRDFSGWIFTMSDGADPTKIWTVENGLLKCGGQPHGYMRTGKAYRDYRLTLEWRFTTPGNTGVLVHMGLPDQVWPRSFECQGMYRHQGDIWLWGGADCKEPKIPGRNGFTKKVKSIEKEPGEWNTYEVLCRGATIKIYVNGKLMNTATDCNASSGFIGLQSEGGAFEVRKITLAPASR